MYWSEILSKNSKPSFARSSSCLCKKLIFWWERVDDWQPRLLAGGRPRTGGGGASESSLARLRATRQPHLIINLWIDLNPTLDHAVFQVFYLNFHQSEDSLVPASRPYNLTSPVLNLWVNLNINFTFDQSASLFQVFYPNIHQSEAVFT